MKKKGSSIADHIIVRYRKEDHLRFSLPEVLCSENIASKIESELLNTEGIYRAVLSRKNRKLSIRWDSTRTEIGKVAKKLKTVVDLISVEAGPDFEIIPVKKKKIKNTPAKQKEKLLERVKGKLLSSAKDKSNGTNKTSLSIRERIDRKIKNFIARKIVDDNKSGDIISKNAEEIVVMLLNDLVIFYLIRVHWSLISKEWIKYPFKYYKEWMSFFYLVFLYVRHQKHVQKNK